MPVIVNNEWTTLTVVTKTMKMAINKRRSWRTLIWVYVAVSSLLTVSCSRSNIVTDDSSLTSTVDVVTYANLLAIYPQPDGSMAVEIHNPWDTTQILQRLYLVNKECGKQRVPEGYTLVRVPIRNALVYSSVHTSPIEELGATDVISGVADGEFFSSPEMRSRLDSNRIVNIGSSMSPSLEKIMSLSPEIAIVSPYQNSGHGILDKSGVTVIDMADYMETTPVGRAEWILLLGALTGHYDKAKAIFESVVADYDSYRTLASESGSCPTVLLEVPYSGVWYQPGGKSYMAALIRDAGGVPLLDNDSRTGSVQMDIASVYNMGHNADIWLIKTTDNLTMADIASLTPLADGIKAFATGNVYIADTSEIPLYDDMAFHPERVLKDHISIFHPELLPSFVPKYYHQATAK